MFGVRMGIVVVMFGFWTHYEVHCLDCLLEIPFYVAIGILCLQICALFSVRIALLGRFEVLIY